ncbi:MAG: hypothetical protein RL685_5419 [Pseudomonadota bacterium]|jgi:hypothetical protein
MVVVVITGILAGLGFASLKKQVNAAWRAEGLTMVQSIRAAQERWRGEHMVYLDVSSAGTPWYPAVPERDVLHPFYFSATGQHIDQANWFALRPNAPGPVRFGYLVDAGAAHTVIPIPAETPMIPDNDWYVIQAIGKTADGDSFMRASSLNGNVFVEDTD